jgi:uncharacterized protein
MRQMIFLNLPVADLARSREFFGALGWHFNEQFTDENATMLVISEEISAMLLTHERFAAFTPKRIVDAASATECLIGLSAPDREAVDTLVDKALAAGATPLRDPDDHGFMYGRSFNDLDGHVWEIVWMDPTGMPTG